MNNNNYIKKGIEVFNTSPFYLYKLLKHETSNGYKYYGYKLFEKIDDDIYDDITHNLQTSKKYGWRGDKKNKATIVVNSEDVFFMEILIKKDIKNLIKNIKVL